MLKSIYFFLLFISATLFAQGTIYIPQPPPQLPPFPIKLEAVEAVVKIKNHVGKVRLQQQFKNETAQRLEGSYIYSMPQNSYLDGFSLFINGKKTRGAVLESNKARSVYEQIVRSMRDPALLEFMGAGLFKARIFPIEGYASRKVELSYSHILEQSGTLYKFVLPIKQSGQGAINHFNLKIEIDGKDKIAQIYSPSHKIEIKRPTNSNAIITLNVSNMDGAQNFILYYTAQGNALNSQFFTYKPRSDRDGWFMFMAEPDLFKKAVKSTARDFVFVVDGSGSMGGEKMAQAKAALKYCLNVLNREDRFEIILFNGSIRSFSSGLKQATSAAKKDANWFIESIQANGGTNINAALTKAFSLKSSADGRPTNILFLTDGLPTEGETDVVRIAQNINKLDKGFIRLFNFGVGYDVNTWLLDLLAKENRGSVNYVQPQESIETSISQLIAKISHPVLTDVQLQLKGIKTYDIYPAQPTDLFKGSRIIICGRYSGSGKIEAVMRGKKGKQEKQFSTMFRVKKREQENSFVASIWANKKVNALLNKIRFKGENAEWVQSIKQLAKQYGIITPYSSWLVTEQEKEAVYVQSQPHNSLLKKRLAQRSKAMVSSGFTNETFGHMARKMEAADQASGALSVLSSKTRQDKLSRSEQASQMLVNHKHVLGKAFTLKQGVWQQLQMPSGKPISIRFLSKPYFQLLKKHPSIKLILALGPQLLFSWQGKIYSIENK